MKDSGVDWLGEVPEHWDVRRLKFSVIAIGGGTPNTSNPDYWDGEIPWASPKDMKVEYLNQTQDYITALGVSESTTSIVPSNTVLIVVRSGILKHSIPVAINNIPMSINQGYEGVTCFK
jgi:restriction endonuclease S subunit